MLKGDSSLNFFLTHLLLSPMLMDALVTFSYPHVSSISWKPIVAKYVNVNKQKTKCGVIEVSGRSSSWISLKT